MLDTFQGHLGVYVRAENIEHATRGWNDRAASDLHGARVRARQAINGRPYPDQCHEVVLASDGVRAVRRPDNEDGKEMWQGQVLLDGAWWRVRNRSGYLISYTSADAAIAGARVYRDQCH